ncbi:hypothetical protein BOTBODRAFT_36984 [Botryobasidium botryosum FD-172 SS1]|uniref:F-box domain-containing protein n=1 Tax=Botryobasidium botryosum (strain FD-172 SS1) TaxID=930990 RepID=A0A067MDA8_BOTB1|nr:hypothetical protein BOTBODRAFT_36984 [Botryobasidium botryosum FD-172 SS1]
MDAAFSTTRSKRTLARHNQSPSPPAVSTTTRHSRRKLPRLLRFGMSGPSTSSTIVDVPGDSAFPAGPSSSRTPDIEPGSRAAASTTQSAAKNTRPPIPREFITPPRPSTSTAANPDIFNPRSISPAPSFETSRFTLVMPPSPSSYVVNFDNQDNHPSFRTTTPNFFTPVRSFPATPRTPRTPKERDERGFLPRLWEALASPTSSKDRKGKGKRKVSVEPFDDLPLDGEEGELIDDEACFIEARESVGMDIISLLPIEISLQILLFLDLPSIIASLSVSRYWNVLASDYFIWRDLFYRQSGWHVNAALAMRQLHGRPRIARSGGTEVDSLPPLSPAATRNISLRSSLSQRPTSASTIPSIIGSPSLEYRSLSPPTPTQIIPTPSFALDWNRLYKTRLDVDRRWARGEPAKKTITGHTDSVYCLEFDSEKIITGSRDRTIKIWSLRTKKLLQTLHGHEGSVLCLKFDRSGFMVSGSSDRQVFVWDISNIFKGAGEGGRRRGVLRGHAGGVLDLRIDDKWIVSSSKDAIIRVWHRATLELHCALQGHEGPVNAVGLQAGRIVSASGDGKMMLWDIESRERIRTFEGHPRGLACVDFKGDTIVSGSNDHKIKVWSASTGECLQTLSGHTLLVRALSFNPELGRLVSASYDQSVRVWDLRTGLCVREFKDVHESHIFDVKFDVTRIISTSHDQKINILDFGEGLDTRLFY